jgi:hypothetical protein
MASWIAPPAGTVAPLRAVIVLLNTIIAPPRPAITGLMLSAPPQPAQSKSNVSP